MRVRPDITATSAAVGAHAVVTRDVAPGALVATSGAGIPARPVDTPVDREAGGRR
jgi:serine acetyltransferase